MAPLVFGWRLGSEVIDGLFTNNDIDARCILVTRLHCGTPEARLSAIYIVNSVGTSHMVGREFASGRVIPKTIIKW